MQLQGNRDGELWERKRITSDAATPIHNLFFFHNQSLSFGPLLTNFNDLLLFSYKVPLK